MAERTEKIKLEIDAESALRSTEEVANKINEIKEQIEVLRKTKMLDEAGIKKALEVGFNPADVKAAFKELDRASSESKQKMAETANSIRSNMQNLKDVIKDVASTYKVSWEDAGKAAVANGKATSSEVSQALREIKKEAKSMGSETTTAMGDASSGGNKLSSSFINLGSVGKFVFGSVLGISAVGALRSLIQFLEGAATAGYDFVKATYQMEVGIRAMQRAGVDTTIQAWYDKIDETGKRFVVFSRQELLGGAANLSNLTRDMRFTEKQIFDLMDATTTLAIVTGKSMEEVQRTVALAIASGYTEGLQRLGLSINKVNIALKANELGYKGGYMALNEYQRGQATQALILEKVANYERDLEVYQRSAPGQVDAMKTAWKNFTTTLGEELFPVLAVLASVATELIGLMEETVKATGFLTSMKNNITEVLIFQESLIRTVKVLYTFYEILERGAPGLFGIDRPGTSLKNFTEALKEAFNPDIDAEEFQKKVDSFFGYLGDTAIGAGQEAEERLQAISDAAQSTADSLSDIVKDNEIDMREAHEDYLSDLEKMERKYVESIAKYERDLANDLEKIERERLSDIGKEQRDYANDLAGIDRDIEDAKQKAAEKARSDDEKEEAKHFEKLRQLREQYLYNLEDALRERDAKAVLRLTREYRMNKENIINEYNIDKKFRKDNLEAELKDLEISRAQKKRERLIAFNEKIADINREAAAEVVERRIKQAESLEELRIAHEIDLKERQLQLNAQYEQIKQHLNDRLKLMAEALIEEYNLSESEMKALSGMLSGYLGSSGSITWIYKNFLNYLSAGISSINKSFGGVANPSSFIPVGPPAPKTIPQGFAEGGSFIASKPTMALFGESGIERIDITPLTRSGANVGRKFGGGIPAGLSSGASGGKVLVEIDLSDGLVGKIIEQSISEVADVALKLRRA